MYETNRISKELEMMIGAAIHDNDFEDFVAAVVVSVGVGIGMLTFDCSGANAISEELPEVTERLHWLPPLSAEYVNN